MVYEILRISLNALWVNQILLKIDELLKNFPTSSHFVQLLKERNDKIMLQMFCGLDDSFCDKNRSEEVKMIVWFNHVSEMLGVLEGILTQLKLVPRYQIEVESQPSSLIGTFENILKNYRGTGYKTLPETNFVFFCNFFQSNLSRYFIKFQRMAST